MMMTNTARMNQLNVVLRGFNAMSASNFNYKKVTACGELPF